MMGSHKSKKPPRKEGSYSIIQLKEPSFQVHYLQVIGRQLAQKSWRNVLSESVGQDFEHWEGVGKDLLACQPEEVIVIFHLHLLPLAPFHKGLSYAWVSVVTQQLEKRKHPSSAEDLQRSTETSGKL